MHWAPGASLPSHCCSKTTLHWFEFSHFSGGKEAQREQAHHKPGQTPRGRGRARNPKSSGEARGPWILSEAGLRGRLHTANKQMASDGQIFKGNSRG